MQVLELADGLVKDLSFICPELLLEAWTLSFALFLFNSRSGCLEPDFLSDQLWAV